MYEWPKPIAKSANISWCVMLQQRTVCSRQWPNRAYTMNFCFFCLNRVVWLKFLDRFSHTIFSCNEINSAVWAEIRHTTFRLRFRRFYSCTCRYNFLLNRRRLTSFKSTFFFFIFSLVLKIGPLFWNTPLGDLQEISLYNSY